MTSFGDSTGTRKRKKPARYSEYEDDEFGSENDPPTSNKRSSGGVLAKADEQLAAPQSIGATINIERPCVASRNRTPLVELNFNTPLAPGSGVVDLTSPPELPPLAMPLTPQVQEEEIVWDRPAGVGLPGQLKNLRVINFMCHEHLYMDFGPNINFISGQNGSGKSAVLQAIQQVLGVRARDTGRANSQAEFIKAGCHEASVEITLWNAGPDAYAHNVFGDEIIIERRIGKAASISIRTEKGRKVGGNKEDLEMVLDALQINAANPIAVMTQDTTRSFMDGGAGKRDRQKYEIYMEATALARIAEANAAAGSQLNIMHAEVQSEHDKYNTLAKDLKRAESRVESLRILDEAKKEEVVLRNALGWASVAATKADIERMNEQLNVVGPRLRGEAAHDLQEAKQRLQTLEDEKAKQTGVIENFVGTEQDLQQESSGVRKKRAAYKRIHSRKKSQLDEIVSKEEILQERQKGLLKNAKMLDADLYAKNAELLAKNAEEKEELERERDRFTSLRDEASAVYHNHGVEHSNLQKKIVHAQADVIHAEKEIKAQQEEIQEYQMGMQNKLYRFGQHKMVALVAGINQNSHKFQRLPVGPIGSLLVLKDKRYAKAADVLLSPYYYHFIVHDKEDLKAFRHICKSVGYFPPYFVARLDIPLHMTQRSEPPSGISTLYHLLGCNEEPSKAAVINALIDEVGIEQCAVVKSGKTIEIKKMLSARNVFSVCSRDGQVARRRGKCMTFFPAPRKYLRLSKLEGCGQDGLAELHAQVEGLREAYKEANVKLAASVAELDSHRQSRLGKLGRKQELENQVNLASLKITELLENQKEALEAAEFRDATADTDVELAALKSEIAEVAEELNDVQQTRIHAEKEESEALHNLQQAEQELNNIDATVYNLQAENSAAMSNQIAQQEALEQAEEKIQAMELYCEHLEDKLQLVTDALERSVHDLSRQSEKAVMVCTEEEGMDAVRKVRESLSEKLLENKKGMTEADVAPTLLPEIILKKFDRVQKKISTEEAAAGGTREDLEADLKCLQRKEKLSKRSLDNLYSAYNLLKAGFDWRSQQYDRMEKTVEETVNCRFNCYLNKKGHNGSIKIVAQKTRMSEEEYMALEIKVLIDGSKTTGRVKDLKQLSGGERSFTTVAFSLALGEFTGCPFRAMDEFDVFMDAVNRQVALESLIQNALENRHLQFLFLTPLDISAVEGAKERMRERKFEFKDNFIRIVRMQAARSGNIQS